MRYDSFADDEKALHGVIRAITQHSMRPVNQALSDWLKADTEFKTAARVLRLPVIFAASKCI